jgi:hypothetical protein
MERANRRSQRLLPVFAVALLQLAHRVTDALLHFARGFVGERDGENIVRAHALLDQVSDAKSNHARLARACAGKDQHRTFGGLNSRTLRRVERGQI